jgi:anti-repressor protein
MNALLAPGAQQLTMTSREIAELTGKRHDNVMPVCRALRDSGVCPQIQETPYANEQNGQTYQQCVLNKRDSYVLVARLSPEFTARLVDRWQELEAGTQPALNLRQPAQMLAVAMQLAEMVQEQQAQLAAQAPKVKFAEAVGASEDLQSIGAVAKVLGTGSRRLFAWLRDNGILTATNLPMQHHLDAGRFRVVERTWRDGDGRDHIHVKTMVTGRGITYLQQKWAKAHEAAHA